MSLGGFIKKILIIALMLWITSSFYCWQSVGFKINDHELVKNYQLPTWGYSIFDIDLSGNGYYRRSDTDYKRVNESYGIKLSPGYLRNFESEIVTYKLRTNASSDIRYSYSENEESQSESIQRYYSNHISFDGDCNYYVANNLFLNFSVDSRFIYYERNFSVDSQDYIDRSIFTGSFIGIGFGRIRDVSPVFRALRLRERVEALNRGMTLSEKQIEALSEKFALYPQYENVYDRYEKYFWKEISPILGSEFDALGLSENLYLTEVMKEYIRRYQGNEILLGINFWQDYEIENDGKKNKELFLGPSIRYSSYNNINLKYQIGVTSNVSYLKNLSDYSEDAKLRLNLSNSHYLDITDRLRWNSSISVNYDYIWYENYDGYKMTTTLTSYLDYFVENSFSIYLQLKSQLIHIDPNIYENDAYSSPVYPDLKRDESVIINLGCRYYFGSMF